MQFLLNLYFFVFISVKNVTWTLITLVENDHRDDWSPEKDCFWRPLVRKRSHLSQLIALVS